MEVTIDEYGRIVVPKSLRDRLGIGAGTELAIEEENGRLVLQPIPERAVLEERDGLLVSTAEVNSDVDVEAVIDEVRKTRNQTIAGTESDE
jgi:AbrB family looped-hinge helix DNA binding protein